MEAKATLRYYYGIFREIFDSSFLIERLQILIKYSVKTNTFEVGRDRLFLESWHFGGRGM